MSQVDRPSPDQFVLDFSSRANERCALLQQLRAIRLPMTQGRIEGVIDLLQRLTLFTRYLPESIEEPYSVDAQVTAIAARIERRKSVSEKTVRNWTRDAKELGLLQVVYMSKEFGGRRWNVYEVNFAAVIDLIRQPVPGGNGRKRAVTITDPRAVTITDPLNVFNKENTNDSLGALSDGTVHPDASEVVVSALFKLSMSEDGARKCVARALTRGLTYEAIDQLIDLYRALHKTDTTGTMTIGWLYRWLSGLSQPPQPKPLAASPQRRIVTPAIDREELARARAAARSVAQTDLPMAEQLRQLRERAVH